MTRLSLLALLAFSTTVASGHQLDEYLQATLVEIEPGDIRLEINLTPGVAVADQVLGLIDTDHDGAITETEAAAYGELLKHDLVAQLDGRSIEMKLTASNFPELEELRTGFGIIQMEYTATPGELAAGKHQLRLENRHLLKNSAYLINAAKPKSGLIQISSQKRNEDQSTGEIGFTYEPLSSPSSPRRLGVPVGVAVISAITAAWMLRRKGSEIPPRSTPVEVD